VKYLERPELKRWKARKNFAKRKINPEVDVPLMMTLYNDEGWTMGKIARYFDVSPSSITYWLSGPEYRQKRIGYYTNRYHDQEKHKLKISLKESTNIKEKSQKKSIFNWFKK
jgi:hypothetical protein